MQIRMQSPSIRPRTVFCLGLLIAFLALSPAIIPYGGRYVTRGDYIEQQLPFLTEAQRILRNGLDTYSFSTFLGAPAVGSYAFYTLGSPFVWPLALLPKALLPYGISLMAILKHAVGMLSAFLYFRKMKLDDSRALLGAILYVFSSFTVVNTQFYHFTEIIAFFPLLLLGLESIMQDPPKPGILAFACALCTLTNYYFMFGSALLCILYAAFRFFSPAWAHPRRFRRLLAALFEAGFGCGLAGFLLCPAMLFMLQITRTGEGQNLLQLYEPADLLERLRVLFMPIESNVVHAFYGTAQSWNSTAAWLPLFGMTGTLLFFRHSSESWLKKLLSALLICSFVPILCGLFVLESNANYTRWWYGLVLMLTLCTLYVLGPERPFDNAQIQRKDWVISFFICLIILLCLTLPVLISSLSGIHTYLSQHLPRLAAFFTAQHGDAYASPPFRIFALVLTGIVITSLLLLLHFRPDYRALIACTALIAVLAYAGYLIVGDTWLLSGGEQPGQGIYTLSEIAEPTMGALELDDRDSYTRIDYGLKLRNYGLLRGDSSLTVFQSLRSSYVGRFITLAGFGYNESTTVSPPNSDGAIRALLSVTEYHLTDPTCTVPDGFVYDRTENGFPVYVNPNAVPMGFLQTAVTGTHHQPMNPEDIGPVLLAAVALDEPYLSQVKETMETLDVYNIPDWKDSVSRLQAQACDTFTTSAHGFAAHIDAGQAGLLVFTIPYDKGFTAQIDGNPADIIPCDLAFMAVAVQPGSHEIRFTYHTRGLTLGICLSCVSALFLAVYFRLIRKKPIL